MQHIYLEERYTIYNIMRTNSGAQFTSKESTLHTPTTCYLYMTGRSRTENRTKGLATADWYSFNFNNKLITQGISRYSVYAHFTLLLLRSVYLVWIALYHGLTAVLMEELINFLVES